MWTLSFMEIMSISKWISSSCGVAMVVLTAWSLLKWVWMQPRKLERHLRLQGIKGTSYKFLFGDTKEMRQMVKEANQKPINIHDDIIPRLMPFVYKATKTYGISLQTQNPFRIKLELNNDDRLITSYVVMVVGIKLNSV
ncbi:cytochrome P450 [Artemisia annua]|uniref:Cytochrome P450 n=1 Tax=Artemisia annua TaxID=35608 RepID=A0A2U1MSY4_ARTAN|nr:cytochrome P450 [Artemisia annua]